MEVMFRRFRHVSLLLLSTAALIVPALGQQLPAGPQVQTFFSDLDDTEQPYGLYIPPDYSPKKKYPLVIMLHGAGSNHRLALRRVFGKSNATGETDVEATRYFPDWKPVEYIVASPYARGTAGYTGVVEKDVWDVLADVRRRFSVDEDRIYLTGLSMGGGGTLWLGLTRPDVWAAIAPVCPAPPPGADALAPNALNLPVHFFQGDADMAVPVANTRNWVNRMKGLGIRVEYKEYPGVGHNSWEKAYEDGFIFKWFSQFKRDPHPDRVRFVSSRYKYNKAYWVRFDRIAPGQLASIDAGFTGHNKIEIATSSLEALTLNLQDHPEFKENKPLQISIDGTLLTLENPEPVVSLVRQEAAWSQVPSDQVVAAKRQGLEGPVYDAFSSRHLYVYGTLDNPPADVAKARREMAEQAANWSVYRGSFLGRMMFFPRVASDKEVRPSDLVSSNLILFGTRETNSLIAQYADQLPIHLQASAQNHGLIYVFPVNDHYVVVNSGLPWWTNAKADRFMPLGPAPLPRFPDFALFRDSVTQVLAQGNFDNYWKLMDEDTARLQATGVVYINGVNNKPPDAAPVTGAGGRVIPAPGNSTGNSQNNKPKPYPGKVQVKPKTTTPKKPSSSQ